MSIPFQLRLATRLMNHGTSLPHRPALSLNLRDIFKILQATEKKKKKRENNATTKQLSPRELATDTAVSLIQLYQGRDSDATLKCTQENPGLSVLGICFLFTPHIIPDT